jgi:NSS family neurotransmitter:Na+ symporter
MVMCGVIIMSGVKNGIERCVKTMMPALFVLIILLDIRACTLDGASEGLKFLFLPDFSKITVNSVLNALGQSFFSLSLGMGALMTYASYISRDENLTGISLRVVVADTFVSVLAGIAILPAVFAFGVNPSAGPNLVYITLPQVFDAMPLGYVWGIVFFVLLTFAALTSAISLLEVCVAYLTEELKFKRLSATALSTGVIAALGVLCTLSFGPMRDVTIFGRTFFDAFDALSSNIVLPVGGIFICLFVGWKMKTLSVYSELSSGGRYPMGMFKIFMFIVKYVAPAAILMILLGSIGIFK